MKQYKYLAALIVSPPFDMTILDIERRIAQHTDMPYDSNGLPPKITFHPPITKIDEKTVKTLVHSMSLQVHQTRFITGCLSHFGKEYIVLLICATKTLANFWVGVTNLLARLPDYVHDPHDSDNMLHITVASHTTQVFDRAWPAIKADIGASIEPTTVFAKEIGLYRQEIGTASERFPWEEIARYPLQEPPPKKRPRNAPDSSEQSSARDT